jgi:hypothetical protein
MKKVLLSLSLLFGLTVTAQDCQNLFISEYVEGWSNNKALEIYNPTENAIDLSEYMVIRYSNGNPNGLENLAVQLTGTIAPYDVYVAVLDKQDPNGTGQEAPVWDSLQARADGFYCPDYNVSAAMYFNGNDAVVLAKGTIDDIDGSQLIDIFGKIGQNPDTGTPPYDGWTDSFPFVNVGKVITTDHSMIRKPTVKSGQTYLVSAFDGLAEYDTIPPVIPILDSNGDTLLDSNGDPRIQGNWASLGSHDCECASTGLSSEQLEASLTVFPNPSATGEFNITSSSKITEVEVYNTLGKVVYSNSLQKGIKHFTIQDDPGVYIINIRTIEGSVATRRAIIN